MQKYCLEKTAVQWVILLQVVYLDPPSPLGPGYILGLQSAGDNLESDDTNSTGTSSTVLLYHIHLSNQYKICWEKFFKKKQAENKMEIKRKPLWAFIYICEICRIS
jgi:hypothetical protein